MERSPPRKISYVCCFFLRARKMRQMRKSRMRSPTTARVIKTVMPDCVRMISTAPSVSYTHLHPGREHRTLCGRAAARALCRLDAGRSDLSRGKDGGHAGSPVHAGKRVVARDLSLTDRYFYAKIIFTKRGLSSKKGHGFCGRGGMADALVLGASTSVCGFKSHRPHQLVASDISLATSFFISLQSSSRAHSAAPRFQTATALRWAAVWARRCVAAIFYTEKISILTVPPTWERIALHPKARS